MPAASSTETTVLGLAPSWPVMPAASSIETAAQVLPPAVGKRKIRDLIEVCDERDVAQATDYSAKPTAELNVAKPSVRFLAVHTSHADGLHRRDAANFFPHAWTFSASNSAAGPWPRGPWSTVNASPIPILLLPHPEHDSVSVSRLFVSKVKSLLDYIGFIFLVVSARCSVSFVTKVKSTPIHNA
jgi:hypothetical protein